MSRHLLFLDRGVRFCRAAPGRVALALAGLVVSTAAGPALAAPPAVPAPVETVPAQPGKATPGPLAFLNGIPFWGKHQRGIVTAGQTSTYFAAFDLVTDRREELVALLRRRTIAAARMSAGQTAGPLSQDRQVPAADTGDGLGLLPSRSTLTFGFGGGLFVKDGKDRFGLAARRPEGLVDMPAFNGDQLVAGSTGGDLSVQACADDPQVAFHAVRQLARMAEGVAQLRWVQAGYFEHPGPASTGRNLMGFLDGTGNPATVDPKLMDEFIWVGGEGPAWSGRDPRQDRQTDLPGGDQPGQHPGGVRDAATGHREGHSRRDQGQDQGQAAGTGTL